MSVSPPVNMEEARKHLEEIMQKIYQQTRLTAQNYPPLSAVQTLDHVRRPRKQKTPVHQGGPAAKKRKTAPRSRQNGRFSKKPKESSDLLLPKVPIAVEERPAMEDPPTPRADPEILADTMSRIPCPLVQQVSQEIPERAGTPAPDLAAQIHKSDPEEEEFIDVVGLDEEPPKLTPEIEVKIGKSQRILSERIPMNISPPSPASVIDVEDISESPEVIILSASPKSKGIRARNVVQPFHAQDVSDVPSHMIKKPKSEEPHFFFRNRYTIEKDMLRATATIVLHDRAGRGKKSSAKPTDEAVFIHYLYLSNKTKFPLMLKGAKLDLIQMEEAWDKAHDSTEEDEEKAFNLWNSLCKQSWGDNFMESGCKPSDREDSITEDRLLHLIRINSSPTARVTVPHVPRLLPAVVRSRQAEIVVLREKCTNC